MLPFIKIRLKLFFISNSNDIDDDLISIDFFFKLSSIHRHLGVTFNSDAKWSDYKNEVYKSAMKKIMFYGSLNTCLSVRIY